MGLFQFLNGLIVPDFLLFSRHVKRDLHVLCTLRANRQSVDFPFNTDTFFFKGILYIMKSSFLLYRDELMQAVLLSNFFTTILWSLAMVNRLRGLRILRNQLDATIQSSLLVVYAIIQVRFLLPKNKIKIIVILTSRRAVSSPNK